MFHSPYSAFLGAIALVFGFTVSVGFGEELRNTPERTELPADPVVVPLRMVGVQPSVDVRVNGEGPFRFCVDTGAAGCGRISAELAERLGLSVVGEVAVGDPSGRNMETAKRVGVASIVIGDARFSGITMMRGEGKAMPEERREHIDGILGFGLFAESVVTFDYLDKNLVIERGALPPADGLNVLRYRAPYGIPELTLTIGGMQVDADIDTGSMGPLTIPESVADKLAFLRNPVVVGRASTGFNEFEIREGQLKGDVRIGGQTIQDPRVAVVGLFPRCNIGGQFLQDFMVSFDEPNQRLRFGGGEARQSAREPRYRVGLMMMPDSCGIRVDRVVEGSPAEKSGVRAGDCITQINGKTAEQYEQAALVKVFGSPSPVNLMVDRAGRRLEVVVTPAAVE